MKSLDMEMERGDGVDVGRRMGQNDRRRTLILVFSVFVSLFIHPFLAAFIRRISLFKLIVKQILAT